ncbi:MAG: LysM peptidoglycan-binding domain-containing protein [Verrucomicrobia bacterium]|jgi:LysM repeat protein|nr:LysM peptidoglycan-binding domain-containing protein [Verrucomicrobiota bacterium]
MMRSFLPVFLCLGALCVLAAPLAAQSDNLRVSVANLTQDVRLLTQEVKTMRLEVEELHRENARLRKQVAAASSNRDTQSRIAELSSGLERLRREYRSADEAQKEQIISEISRQMNAFAKETQAAIDAIAEAVGSQPQIETPVRFSSDFPQTGITYTVRSGDTLSKIARDHGSTIKHIQNANKIVNPSRDLKVGETIFIPIAE